MATCSRCEATNQCAAKTTFMQTLRILQHNLQSVFKIKVTQSIGAASNNSVVCLAEHTNAVPGTEESAKQSFTAALLDACN